MADQLLLPPPLAGDERFRVLGQLAARVSEVDLSPLLVYLVDTVDASALPVLAEQFHLLGEGWELAPNEDERRLLIKTSIELHRHKGTPYAVRLIFRVLGMGEIDLIEGRGGYRRDGTCRREAFYVRGDSSEHWAVYRVVCYQLITTHQALLARSMLETVAPVRCLLYDIDFSSAALVRNGYALRDGTYSRGSA